jgi:folylpolyglutamate synthase
VEAILRAHGLKTGMYTSPHLVHITERIQVNGQAISQERFADCFWRSWDAIQAGLSPQYPRPPGFFKFLTLMGLRVLLEEQVDVGVIEVGIGGRTDATNVLAGARVGGVAPIGYDHQEVLGESLAEIAFEESGIARPGLPVLTVREQPLEALESLWRVARARGLDLRLVPPLAAYNPLPRLSLRGRHQQVNAALAIALARRFLQLEDYSQSLQLPLPPPPPAGHIPLDSRFLSALATTEVQTFSPFARFSLSLSLFSFTPHTRILID